MADAQQNARYVVVGNASSGSNIANLAVTAWVDLQNGNGPQLVTLYLQAVAAMRVDPNGTLYEIDEVELTADWKRQMLDEIRAMRLGMEQLCENRRDITDYDQSLIDRAQSIRDEPEDQTIGREAAGNGAN